VELVLGVGEVVEADDRVVLLPMGGIELDLLREDRPVREARVPAAVIEVEVTIHHDADVVRSDAGGGEGIVERTTDRMVELLDLFVALGDAGIEQDQPVGVVDQVPTHDDLLAGSRIPVVRDREVAEQDAPDAVEGNHRARNSSGQSGSC
jgi:hypothetical protein